MQLNNWVFYRVYKDSVIVYNSKSHRFFTFNTVGSKIVDYLGKNNTSFFSLVKYIHHKYQIPLFRAFYDCNIFIKQLKSDNLIFGNIQKDITVNKSRSNTYDDSIFRLSSVNEPILQSAMLEITYNCNLKCKHCYVDYKEKQPELQIENWKAVIDELYDNNVFFLTFTGGELCTVPNWIELIQYAVSKKFVVDIFTNGTLLTKNDLDKLSMLNIRTLHVSIYGVTSETHDAITTIPNSFDKSIAVLKYAHRLGIPTNIKSVAMNQNMHEMAKLKKLADELGATTQIGVSLSPSQSGNLSCTKYRINELSILSDIIKNCVDCSITWNKAKDLDSSICGAGFNSLSINPFGDVFPCNSIYIKCGNVFTDGINSIWKNSDVLNMLRNLKFKDLNGCKKCQRKNYCTFCIGSALSETGNIDAYDEACTIAKAREFIYEGKKIYENNKAP